MTVTFTCILTVGAGMSFKSAMCADGRSELFKPLMLLHLSYAISWYQSIMYACSSGSIPAAARITST